MLTEIINQIKNQAQEQTSTFHALNNYKCNDCKDTGWILSENGYKRCSCFELDLVNRLWENFGVKASDLKMLNEYKPYNELTTKAKQKAVEYIKTYENIKNTRENGFGLFGQPGAGKTHIVTAIGKALLENKIPVVYMPYLEVMRELKANSMDDEHYEKLSNRYKRAKVLIIDDLFKDKVKKGKIVGELSEADMKHIYPILNYRYLNYLPTLISTECTPEMLLNLDEALGGRVLECCSNFGVSFSSDCNYRIRKFMQ